MGELVSGRDLTEEKLLTQEQKKIAYRKAGETGLTQKMKRLLQSGNHYQE